MAGKRAKKAKENYGFQTDENGVILSGPWKGCRIEGDRLVIETNLVEGDDGRVRPLETHLQRKNLPTAYG